MITIRQHEDRGYAEHDWLASYHSFSFGMYHDPKHMHFRSLRVINEDVIQPGKGFDMHPHRNMEIITYVVSGALAHEDSMGSSSVLKPGSVQVMSAGTGVTHSEFNPSLNDKAHILQIWIMPNQDNVTPCYAEKEVLEQDKTNKLYKIAGPQDTPDALPIHQDAYVYVSRLEKGQILSHQQQDRYGYIQVINGQLDLNGHELNLGDGAMVSDEHTLVFTASEDTEFLYFDMA